MLPMLDGAKHAPKNLETPELVFSKSQIPDSIPVIDEGPKTQVPVFASADLFD